jgi:hypothetical protein
MAEALVLPLTKVCPRCRQDKPISEFTIRKRGERIGQPIAHCKVCNSDALKQRKQRDRTVYRRIEWPSKLKRLYGLTVEAYYAMLAAQGGVCAICGVDNPCKKRSTRDTAAQAFFVDHCHKTGKVRGLLCNHCNQAIGFLRDNANFAEKLAVYLRSSGHS